MWGPVVTALGPPIYELLEVFKGISFCLGVQGFYHLIGCLKGSIGTL